MSGIFLAAATLADPEDTATAAAQVSGFLTTFAEEANSLTRRGYRNFADTTWDTSPENKPAGGCSNFGEMSFFLVDKSQVPEMKNARKCQAAVDSN